MLESLLNIATPLLLAGLGALVCSIAGFTNIALEGLILSGAFFSITFSSFTNSYVAGVLLACVCCALISAAMYLSVEKFKANLYVAGLAINLLSSGLVATLSFKMFNNKGVLTFSNLKPIWTSALLNQQALFFIAVFLVAISPLVLNKTVWGMRLRACGNKREALDAIGLSSRKKVFEAYVICGVLCALSGACLSLLTHSYVPNMSASRGWIALVLVLLCNNKSFGLLLVCLLYGFCEALGNQMQGLLNVPSDFVLALPYVITLLTLLIYSAVKSRRNRF